MLRWCLYLVSFYLCCFASFGAEPKTEHVFLIMSDGLRWQDVFHGAQKELMTSASGVEDPKGLEKEFWRETPEERRAALMPFLWKVLANQGALLGNQTKGNMVRVTNRRNFSFPGYNEVLSGIADPRIDSNEKKPNPNTNIFEWFNGRPGYRGKVAAFGGWDVFPYIFNLERSQITFWPGVEKKFKPFEPKIPENVVKNLDNVPRQWEGVIDDKFVFAASQYHFTTARPRLMFVGYCETDEWAHLNRYDKYLRAAQQVDDYIRRLWEAAQADERYRNKTTLIVTVDHGRGSGKDDWQGHGAAVTGSDGDWLAIMGPDTPALGERAVPGDYALTQLAATMAELLGENYHAALPHAGNPIQELIRH